MFWFKSKEERKRRKEEKQPKIKPPQSSYDLYNQSQTSTIQTSDSLLVGYEEEPKKTSTTSKRTKNNGNGITKTMQTKTTKNNAKTATNKTARNIYYVSSRKDKDGKKIGWEVKKEKASKVTKICATKEEAITLVKELAGNQGSTCIIRKMDGSIQETLKFDKK